MRMFRLSTLLLVSAFLLLWSSLEAQPSSGGTPLSFTEAFRQAHGELPLKVQKAPRLNLKRILKEDEKFIGVPRFAAPVAVDYSLENSGEWTELEDGGLLWRV